MLAGREKDRTSDLPEEAVLLPAAIVGKKEEQRSHTVGAVAPKGRNQTNPLLFLQPH